MPKRKDPAKLTAIHHATTRLVVKTGFSGMKMAQVAAEAGLATGTLYIYYKNKEVLINEVFLVTRQEIADVMQDESLKEETFYETFEATWRAYFEYCYRQPDKMLFVEQFRYSGMISEKNLIASDGYFEPYNEFLRLGQKQGFLRRMDLETLKAQVRGACHEIVRQLLKKEEEPAEHLLDLCFDMAWSSVRK